MPSERSRAKGMIYTVREWEPNVLLWSLCAWVCKPYVPLYTPTHTPNVTQKTKENQLSKPLAFFLHVPECSVCVLAKIMDCGDRAVWCEASSAVDSGGTSGSPSSHNALLSSSMRQIVRSIYTAVRCEINACEAFRDSNPVIETL